MKTKPRYIHVHGRPDGGFLVEANNVTVRIIRFSHDMLDELYACLAELTDPVAATQMVKDIFDSIVGRGHRDRN